VQDVGPNNAYNDGRSTARFFYTSKATPRDRIGSKHPTIKPVDLLQWLVRLVVPKGGIVLDPFAGTGTLAEAAALERRRSVSIEAEPEYQNDFRLRMNSYGDYYARHRLRMAKLKLPTRPDSLLR
jgi:site-specific DNA-methyltransferase (adenine-specific)